MKSLATVLALLISNCCLFAYKPAESVTESNLRMLSTGLEAFKWRYGRYPTTQEGLDALFRPPARIGKDNWSGSFVLGDSELHDGWGRAFVYVCPGVHNTNGFDLYSLGPDAKSRTKGSDEDDINNWRTDAERTAKSINQNARVIAEFDREIEIVKIVLVLAVSGVAAGLARLWWTRRRRGHNLD